MSSSNGTTSAASSRSGERVESADASRSTRHATLPGGSWLILIGQFFFKYRDLVSPVMVIAIALMQRPRLLFGSRHWDAVLDAAGVLLALSGQILRAAVIGFAYIKRGGKDRQVYADTLVQEGFFAHCRNPLYVGNCLILIGYFVILNTPAGYLIGVPFFAFLYWTIVLAEEDFLRRKFESSYVSYCHAVNRFVPDLRGLRKTLDGMKYDWRRLIRKMIVGG